MSYVPLVPAAMIGPLAIAWREEDVSPALQGFLQLVVDHHLTVSGAKGSEPTVKR